MEKKTTKRARGEQEKKQSKHKPQTNIQRERKKERKDTKGENGKDKNMKNKTTGKRKETIKNEQN